MLIRVGGKFGALTQTSIGVSSFNDLGGGTVGGTKRRSWRELLQ